MKPEHFRDSACCLSCKHCKCTFHHCNACSADDEYSCTKHDFVITECGSDGASQFVCNDIEIEG
jgi:hypothetical protein